MNARTMMIVQRGTSASVTGQPTNYFIFKFMIIFTYEPVRCNLPPCFITLRLMFYSFGLLLWSAIGFPRVLMTGNIDLLDQFLICKPETMCTGFNCFEIVILTGGLT